MPRPRREKTLADYVVIALSPALIMALVGSLVFFLLQVAYRGNYENRMQYILFWFVFGAVLVARIAIEEGIEHARLFGFVLAGATGLVVARFVDAVAIAWVLLAVIWWCAWKLTWDCTLIDDSEDASGEGLLEAAGLTGSSAPGEERTSQPASDSLRMDDRTQSDTIESAKRPHAPGLWVIYFSLAALPLFGVGQLFIPVHEEAARAAAFRYLAVYVASALGLLLTTSFLGLRRYLRQRKLQMPATMAATWIGMGAALLVLLLLAALLIPRPQGDYALTDWINKLDARVRAASKVAVLGGDHGQGEGRRIGQADPRADQPGDGQPPRPRQEDNPGEDPVDNKEAQPPDDNQEQRAEDAARRDPSRADLQSAERAEPSQRADSGRAGSRPGGQANRKDQQNQPDGDRNQQAGREPPAADRRQQGERTQDDKPRRADGAQDRAEGPQRAPQVPTGSFLSQLAPFLKWLIYGLLALLALWVLWRYWSQWVEFLVKLWAEFLSLFGGRREERAATSRANEQTPLSSIRPFADFENPFFSGAARRMPPSQLALYTFEALEAWARERSVSRPADQTPLEFAQELGRRLPNLAKDVSQTAQLYVRVVYAQRTLSNDSVDVFERMWRRMNVGE